MFPRKMIPIIDENYNILIDIKPRTPDEFYVPPEDKRLRPHWTFQMGIFRDYKFDTKVNPIYVVKMIGTFGKMS